MDSTEEGDEFRNMCTWAKNFKAVVAKELQRRYSKHAHKVSAHCGQVGCINEKKTCIFLENSGYQGISVLNDLIIVPADDSWCFMGWSNGAFAVK